MEMIQPDCWSNKVFKNYDDLIQIMTSGRKDYMHIGVFHHAQVVSSIPSELIGCEPRSDYTSVHICWPTHWHLFVSWHQLVCWAGKYYFLLCIRAVASSSPPHVGQVVLGLCLSLRPGLLCGSSLDRALGILDDQGCVS